MIPTLAILMITNRGMSTATLIQRSRRKMKQGAQGARAPRADRAAANPNGRPARPLRQQRALRAAAPDRVPSDSQVIQTSDDGQPLQAAQGVLDMQVGPTRPPREPRQPRAPREPRVQRPPRVEGAANAAGAAFVPNDNVPGFDGDHSVDAGATDAAPTAPGINNGTPNERGPRRNRRGGRGRNARSGGDERNGPRQPRMPYDPNAVAAAGAPSSDATFVDVDGEHSTATPRITNWVLDDAGDDHSGPNPGAFGDPSRPMDRSARRNRNHREKRASSAPPVRIGQGPQNRITQSFVQHATPMFDADGNAIAAKFYSKISYLYNS